MEEAAIFGAGHYGRTAYAYYRDIYHITCYYDNDSMKWGKSLNGLLIRNPEELRKNDKHIIIAVEKYVNEIKQQLRQEYKIYKTIVFSVHEEYDDIDDSIWEGKHVFVVGDSHSVFWSGMEGFVSQMTIADEFGRINVVKGPDERFVSLHMGPALAYNANKYDTSVKFLEKWKRCIDKRLVVPGDTIVFVLGEIDIRCHVFKHVSQDVTYNDVVDDIIYRYIDFLRQTKKEGFRTYVWAPVATQKDNWYTNPSFPRVGSEIERNKATLYFSKKLRQECEKEKIGFLGIAEKLIDSDYRTRAEYIVDQCHLKQTARVFLNQEIERTGLCSDCIE